MTGPDVTILLNLLARCRENTVALNLTSNTFDASAAQAVSLVQKYFGTVATGVADSAFLNATLQAFLADGWVDPQPTLPGGNYLYKVWLPVYADRSIQTTGFLYDRYGNELLNFTARTEGQADSAGNPLNMLAGDGSTPTGLATFDLNTAEPYPSLFGPYPINRVVQGLAGNMAVVIPTIRDGILLHTGEWAGWHAPMPMPNSHGCIHSWPNCIEDIWQTLIGLGVVAHENEGGVLPYPYVPQGIISVQQMD